MTTVTSTRAKGTAPGRGHSRSLRGIKILTAALAAWSLMIWVQRIRNIISNHVGESYLPPVANLVIVAAAVAAVFAAPRALKLVAAMAFGAWSVIWWVVNQAVNLPRPVPAHIPPSQAVPFKIVHAVLGLVAIGLGAGLAWRAWAIRKADAAGR